MTPIQEYPDGIGFKIMVQPRSSRNAIQGVYDGALKIRLTAPPVGGAANKLCLELLAKRIGVPKSSLEIKRGQSSRAKQVICRFPQDMPQAERDKIKRVILDLYTDA